MVLKVYKKNLFVIIKFFAGSYEKNVTLNNIKNIFLPRNCQPFDQRTIEFLNLIIEV